MLTNVAIKDYTGYKDKIKSGDLIAWSKGRGSLISDISMFIIKTLTRSKYGHVGVVYRLAGRIFVIEANMPYVRITPLSNVRRFYHVPMNIKWNNDYELYLLDKIGLKYSIMDCIRAFFGVTTKKDDKWQCAELACEFYKLVGVDLKDSYKPSTLIASALVYNSNKIYRVRNKRKSS